jgi:hypothetical protein
MEPVMQCCAVLAVLSILLIVTAVPTWQCYCWW